MKKYLYLLLLSLIVSCSDQKEIEISLPSTPDDLIQHTSEFKKEVIELVDGVHMDVGLALANSMTVSNTNLTLPTICSV